MQVFKFFILMLIFVSTSIISLLLSKKFSNRVKDLKEIKSALNMLETKIKFTYEPLGEIFKEISKNVSDNLSDFFEDAELKMKTLCVKDAWDFAVDNCNLDINDEDKNVIRNLGSMLRSD